MAQAQAKTGGGAMIFVVIALLLTLVGAGTGFTVGAVLQTTPAAEISAAPPRSVAPSKETAPAHSPENKTPDAETASEEDAAEVIDARSLKAIPFPPVLTTLAEPKGGWIRLEGSILVRADSEEPPELLAEKAGEQILTYLRSVRLKQIEGAAGVLGLRDDLNETVKALSNGQVQGVLIHGLAVE